LSIDYQQFTFGQRNVSLQITDFLTFNFKYMGTYRKGILGPFSGKVGTVIGSSWNGIDYLRSLPKPSGKEATNLQLIQRAKFGLANGFLSPVSALVNQGYKSLAIRKTGFNVAISNIIADAITGAYPDFEIDYARVMFSKGVLVGCWNAVVSSTQPAELDLSWTDNSGSGTAKATDQAVILAYNPAKSQFVYNLETGAERSAATDTLVLPAEFSGDTIQVWIAFMTPDRKLFSTSIHAGQILIA
jgi:hypothetical protein